MPSSGEFAKLSMPEGFLLVDKEGGWTSHDVVAKCRGILGQRRIGHAGTLDPMATGLLVLGIGKATRLLRYVQDGMKQYLATIAFGVATDTLDADGAILDREPMDFGRSDLESVAERFIGSISQIPPMVSAIKVDGRRLYDLAREGVEVERKPRTVQIDALDILDFAPGQYPEAEISVTCGSGTYIRSLADDLAQALGGRAHLSALRRTGIGEHRVDDAVSIDVLQELEDPASAVMPMATGLGTMATAAVSESALPGVSNGMVFAASAIGVESPGEYKVVDDAGRLLAVYRSDGRSAKPEVVVA
jgi:tRNA pseudouridine55 synthase